MTKKQFYTKKIKTLKSTQKYFNETKSLSPIELKEFSLLYLIINNLHIFQENIHLIENIKFFSSENKLIFGAVLSKLKTGEKITIEDLNIDKQLIDKIAKFASIKYILNNFKNDQEKIFELLNEYMHDLKIHGMEVRIEELESKFSKDLSESTFNEIKDLKEQKKKENIN